MGCRYTEMLEKNSLRWTNLIRHGFAVTRSESSERWFPQGEGFMLICTIRKGSLREGAGFCEAKDGGRVRYNEVQRNSSLRIFLHQFHKQNRLQNGPSRTPVPTGMVGVESFTAQKRGCLI